MALSTAGRNASVDGVTGLITHISLHTADPGASGTSEVAGGTYARQAATWGAASGGTGGITNDPEFGIPAATTITHYGLWSASSGGTFYGGDPLSASETYGAAGTYTLTANTVTFT